MRRRGALTTIVLLGALATAPGAGGMPETRPATPPARLSIAFAAFVPGEARLVTGESVAWTNDSVRAHDVAADDGHFDSGRLAPGASFTRRFDEAGTFAYHCEIHPSMRGQVVVSTILLEAPTAPVGGGRSFPLRGRTGLAAGTPVTVTAQASGDRAPTPAATTVVGEDGSFAADVAPGTTTTYRAVAGDATSPAVTLLVLDRRVTGTVRRTTRSARVAATVTPPAPGATVVLQARSREHFGWYPVLRGRLDRRSRVSFTLPLRRRLPLRVVVTLPDGVTVLASSGPLRGFR